MVVRAEQLFGSNNIILWRRPPDLSHPVRENTGLQWGGESGDAGMNEQYGLFPGRL